jgi:Rha family phage regulatory protein
MNVALAHFPDMDAARNPIVQLTDTNEAMADSRDVAAYFDKRHQHVLEAIRNLHCSADFRQRNFRPFKIKDLTGESTSHVTMTKDGFTFLGMGFTGAMAGIFKEKYILAFNAMEAELRRRSAAPVNADDLLENPAALRSLLLGYAGKVEALKAEVAALAPKGEFVDRFINSEGFYGYHEAARALGCRPQYFCKWLRGKYCFSHGKLTPFAEYFDHGIFVTRSFTAPNGHTGPQVFVTPKGIEYFSTRVPAEIKNYQPATALAAAATAH